MGGFVQLPKWKSKAGIGLVAILILVTVLGATGILLTNLLTDALTITKKQGLNDQLEGIRKSIRLQMSCSHTLSGAPCGSTFPIKNSSGAVIGTSSMGAWKIDSDYHIRGKCGGGKLAIEVARLESASTFKKNVSNRSLLDSWKPLFPPSPIPPFTTESDCKSYYAPSTCMGAACLGPLPAVVQTENWALASAPLTASSPPLDCSAVQAPTAPATGTNHYVGKAFCPDGYVAVGGGANCQIPPFGGAIHSSGLTDDGGWEVSCCVYTGPGVPSSQDSGVMVTCIKP